MSRFITLNNGSIAILADEIVSMHRLLAKSMTNIYLRGNPDETEAQVPDTIPEILAKIEAAKAINVKEKSE